MSSRSICAFVECAYLTNGCKAFAHPQNDCQIAKLGFVRDLEVFANVHSFETMGEIYDCVYRELVLIKLIDGEELMERNKVKLITEWRGL